MASVSTLKNGVKIIFQGVPHEVVKSEHIKIGRGGAVVRAKLRNLINGSLVDNSFSSNDNFEEAGVSYKPAQFLYSENDTFNFMINDTFETVEAKLATPRVQFLKEGQLVDLVAWKDLIIDIKIPTKIDLKVEYTEPGFRGDTASATFKPAKLETGATIQVPLFINNGDMIKVNTETASYDSRV